MMETLLTGLDPYIRTVTIVLLHSLWQGFLIGFLAAIVLASLRNSSARIRYAVSCGALVAIILATAVTAVAVWPNASGAVQPASAMVEQSVGGAGNHTGDVANGSSTVKSEVSQVYRWWSDPIFSLYTFVIWVTGVLLFSFYHFLGWRRAHGYIRRGTSPVPDEWQARFDKLLAEIKPKRLASLLSSSLVAVPCVIGWIKPVILVPMAMFTSLEPHEIEMILAHELAHIRRYDVLFNIIQSAVETLFFFNPAVWWISHRIRVEREDCCDDAAINRTGDRLRYARALANLEELRMYQTRFGAALTGAPLQRRIQRIVGVARPRFYSSVLSISGMLLIASLMVVMIGSIGGSKNSVVLAGEDRVVTSEFSPQEGDLQGEWETEMDGNQLKILVYGRRSEGMSYVLDRDQIADLLNQEQKPYQITRDAGTLYLIGKMDERRGRVVGDGRWYFRPDTAYMHFMSRYGLADGDRRKTFSLAIFDISRKYISGMGDRGFHDLNIDQMISAGVFGISPDLVDEYRNIGLSDFTFQQLLSLQVQGVDPDYANRFEKVGLGKLTPEQLISARIQGLTPQYVASFLKAGFRDLTFSNFVTLHGFNLDVDDFEDCYRHRFMDLSQGNMVWVCGFGITQDDIERMQDSGYTDMDTIIRVLAEEYGR